jgi:hypothetical protein
MATKTNKSTVKVGAKNSAKSSGLKTRFNLANRKVQFFVFIAIVALLGGGYFTIKSFAATSTVAEVSNGLLTGSGSYTIVSDAAKNNKKVVRISKAGSAAIIKNGADGVPMMKIPANVKVRYCYLAKADQQTGAFFVGWAQGLSGGKGGAGIPTPNTVIGTSYSTYCTPYENNQNRTNVTMSFIATTNTPVNVSRLYAEYESLVGGTTSGAGKTIK